jgi:hypothetical protein
MVFYLEFALNNKNRGIFCLLPKMPPMYHPLDAHYDSIVDELQLKKKTVVFDHLPSMIHLS